MTSLRLLFLSAILLITPPLSGAEIGAKTPNDVYQRILILKQQVLLLRELGNIREPWPEVEKRSGLAPRHVLQKSLEVLDKIKRLRRIHGMGPITVPLFPTRNITPNEVYDMAGRLIAELSLFPAMESMSKLPTSRGKTSSDIYQALWNISLAINPLLGVRGLKPSDVYSQSLRILGQVKFLRISQSLALDVPPPPRTEGKRPNHTLQQAYLLLGKVAKAEHNLWIEPIAVPSVPRREIKPGEVYDALLIVQAELERIKYRLGMERDIAIPDLEEQKSPDDVLFNLAWAADLMPTFSSSVRLKQYSLDGLDKTPNHLYGLTEHIIEELLEYRKQRGIQVMPRHIPAQANLKPRHIYQKTWQAMAKVSQIRAEEGLGPMALPHVYMREVGLTEVYDLMIRLDAELQILYERIAMPAQLAELAHARFHRDKTEADVFRQMWTIAYLLDSVLGDEGDSSAVLFQQAQRLLDELKIIGQMTGRSIENLTPAPLIYDTQLVDVSRQTQVIMRMLIILKRRMGLLAQALPILPASKQLSLDDAHNSIELIGSELENIKIHLGINQVPSPRLDGVSEKTLAAVLQQLHLATQLLQRFID